MQAVETWIPQQTIAINSPSKNKAMKFVYYQGKKIGVELLNKIGPALLGLGLSLTYIANFEESPRFSARVFGFGGGLLLILGTSSIYASNKLSELNFTNKNYSKYIAQLKDEGNYSYALTISRLGYQYFSKMGCIEEANEYLLLSKLLEKDVLNLGFSRLMFDEHFAPRQKLIKLLEVLGMDNPEKFEQINAWAQENLKRPDNTERWELQSSRFEVLKDKTIKTLEDFGFIHGVTPHFENYTGAIVHGALLKRVILRVDYLIDQWKVAKFDRVYLLGGLRPLTKEEETEIQQKFNDVVEIPKTEIEMMKLVWEKAKTPKDMKEHLKDHVFFVSADMQKDPKDSTRLVRPNTDDTIKAWLKSNPIQGRYLVISNAPYIARQDLVN